MANAPSDAIQRLIDVVAQLRDPTTGWPWDLEQTHASLVPYVLEEAHEVADAIRQGSDAEMKEELGICYCRWCCMPRSLGSSSALIWMRLPTASATN